MLPVERHRKISAAVRLAGTISTEQLAAELNVSAETVRRDLAHLEARGVLVRVRGGAASLTTVEGSFGEEPSFIERSALHHAAKAAIGRTAAALVRDGMTVAIDIGTTAVEVARALPAGFRGLVATPSLLVAAELSTRPDVQVLVPGGRVRPGDLACSGAPTVEFFADLHPDIAFLGSGGVDGGAALTDFYFDEIATKRVLLARSTRCYVLADASKQGRVAPHRVCGLDELTGLITDEIADAELTAAIERCGGTVIAA